MKDLLLAIVFGIALAEGLSGVGQYFHASITKEGVVTFTNLPPHVMFQHSTDLTNWWNKIEVICRDGATNIPSFSYIVTDNRVFVRARIP